MNGRVLAVGFLCASLILPPTVATADDAPPLVHNPFSRPSSEVTIIASRLSDSREDLATPIRLVATLVGSKEKLANVDGRVIRQGEEVDGFRLVEIHEDHAVFLRAGNRTTVYVKPDLVESDE